MSRVRTAVIGFGALIAGVLGVVVFYGPSWWAERLARPVDALEPQGPAVVTAPPLKSAMEIQAYLAALAVDAKVKGVSEATLARATAGIILDDDIAGLNASQPEHVRTAGEYVNLLVSETRIANGRAKLAEHADLMEAIERRYGVDRHIVMAIWGIESAYGISMGERHVVRSLLTLAMTDERRGAFWRGELLAALQILERGDIGPEAMTGSWAGAMGHTQFMPSTYLAHAVDFDGDGRRNIWQQPADALASAANYLKVSGWQAGQPAMIEVSLPPGFDYALSAPGVSRSLADWQALGVRRVGDTVLPDRMSALSLVLPAGYSGPAVLTGANFQAILRYNRAVSYALSVALLAEQLAGRPGLAAPWPADDKALSRGEREELQKLLTGLGHEIGPVDGIIGSATRGAIRLFQKAQSVPEDGHPSLALLVRLRDASERARATK